MSKARNLFLTAVSVVCISGLPTLAQSTPGGNLPPPPATGHYTNGTTGSSINSDMTRRQARKARHHARMMQRFDTNGDGILDAHEQAAMKAWKAQHKQARMMREHGQAPNTPPASFNTPVPGTSLPASSQAH